MAINSTTMRFMWDDTTVELNDARLKKNIPALPKITDTLQTVHGRGIQYLAYLALQVVKSEDRLVILRAVASACSCLFRDNANFTGSPQPTTPLTGLEAAEADDADVTQILKTNFEDSEDVTIGELLTLMEADSDELGAYFGLLFYAGNKRLSKDNRSAFNERRANAASASIIGEPRIFVVDSPLLTDHVMHKMYASFTSGQPFRANITASVIPHLERPQYGPALAFSNMFLLVLDQGMTAMRIIKEAVIKFPWIRTDFPELAPELNAANEAQNILRRAPGRERSFLKAIHGNTFVPVNYSQIDNLTGVCKEILKRTTPSYQNYRGGKVTESQLQRILSHTDVVSKMVETVSAE